MTRSSTPTFALRELAAQLEAAERQLTKLTAAAQASLLELDAEIARAAKLDRSSVLLALSQVRALAQGLRAALKAK